MTKSESRYLGRVAALGCAICNLLHNEFNPNVEIHHVREGQGMAQRAQHWLGVPLCIACHRGPRGIHGDRSILRQLKCDEMDLLSWVISRLNG